jgi:hypothetical protein
VADPPGTPFATAPVPAAAAPAQPDEFYLDELERLAGLRDWGIISDDDFDIPWLLLFYKDL